MIRLNKSKSQSLLYRNNMLWDEHVMPLAFLLLLPFMVCQVLPALRTHASETTFHVWLRTDRGNELSLCVAIATKLYADKR